MASRIPAQRSRLHRDRASGRHLQHLAGSLQHAAVGWFQRQGSLRRITHSDPEGRPVRQGAERDRRLALLEVQQLRQHEQHEARGRMASDRRPAAARHRVRRVPCADCVATCSRARRATRRRPRIRAMATRRPIPPARGRCGPCTGATAFPRRHRATASQINGVISGSQYAGYDLQPEQGKSFDWGFVYDPHWLPGAVGERRLLALVPEQPDQRDRRADGPQCLLPRRRQQPVLPVHPPFPERPDVLHLAADGQPWPV